MCDVSSSVFYIMGVSGSGKTTVGKLLAEKLGYAFYDGDDFHPEANIHKMSQGKPLNDTDREPWLLRLRELARENSETGCVIACSALKAKYRKTLADNATFEVSWIYLDGKYDTILERMKKRKGHFMPEALLRSQFDALEIPDAAINVSVELSPEQQLAKILEQLESKRKSGQ